MKNLIIIIIINRNKYPKINYMRNVINIFVRFYITTKTTYMYVIYKKF